MVVDKKMIDMKTEILDKLLALVEVTEMCLVACSQLSILGHCVFLQYLECCSVSCPTFSTET